jgi:ADP-heptose:LPS heptosyltransferase
VWLLFTNSFRGDLEAWLTRCRHRFGIVRPGHSRPLLTHAYCPPPDFDEQSQHQLKLWEDFLRHFGLNRPADLQPLGGHAGGSDDNLPIALIPGSENTPEKRWPVGHWRALIAALPEKRFIVFGTAKDCAIARAVAGEFGARVENLAGKTDLVAFNERLRGCRLLVTNDTGGMHLANVNGVPLIALFGPTNPFRTRPVFAAPVRILQPPACGGTGGGALDALRPETVIAALRELQEEWHLAGGGAS